MIKTYPKVKTSLALLHTMTVVDSVDMGGAVCVICVNADPANEKNTLSHWLCEARLTLARPLEYVRCVNWARRVVRETADNALSRFPIVHECGIVV